MLIDTNYLIIILLHIFLITTNCVPADRYELNINMHISIHKTRLFILPLEPNSQINILLTLNVNSSAFFSQANYTSLLFSNILYYIVTIAISGGSRCRFHCFLYHNFSLIDPNCAK